MKRLVAIAVVLAAAVIAMWFLRSREKPSADDGGAVARSEVSASAPLASKRTAKVGDAVPALRGAPTAERANGGTVAPATTTIRVRVLTGDSWLAGATVRLRRDEQTLTPFAVGTTGHDGRVAIESAVPSPIVEAFADGFAVSTQEWDLATLFDEQDALLIGLARGVSFVGRVVGAEGGEPIEGASVVLDSGSPRTEIGPTGKDGEFRVPGVLGPRFTLVATARGHAATRLTVRVEAGGTLPDSAVLHLERAGALVGTVKSAGGTPIEGALVWITPQVEEDEEALASDASSARVSLGELRSVGACSSMVLCATSAADGSFRADGLANGTTYAVIATTEGHANSRWVRDVRVAPGAERSIALALRRPATVSLTVAPPSSDSPPVGARVRLVSDGVSMEPDASEDGRFRFADVAPGSARVFVEDPDFLPSTTTIEVEEGADVELEVELDLGAIVEGVVVDADGVPLVDARVVVRRVGGPPRTASTDAAGRFAVRGFRAGDAVLSADWDDPTTGRWLITRRPLVLRAPVRDARVVLARLGSFRARLLAAPGRPFVGKVVTTHGGREVRHVGDGVVHGHRLDDGDHDAFMDADGYAWVRRSITIKDGAVVDLGDIVLDPGVEISGRVVDGDGRPIARVSVYCLGVGDRSTSTDANGRFTLERCPREPVALVFSPPDGYRTESTTVDPAKATGLEIRLRRAAKVRGQVEMPARFDLSKRRTIELRPPSASWSTHVDEQGREVVHYKGATWIHVEDGEFEREVIPGTYVGWWTDEAGKEHRLGEWTFAEGETREIEIVLPAK